MFKLRKSPKLQSIDPDIMGGNDVSETAASGNTTNDSPNSDTNSSQQESPKPSNLTRRHKQNVWLVVIALIIVVCLAGFFGYRKHNHNVNASASVAYGTDYATCGDRYKDLFIISCIDRSSQAEATRLYLGLFQRQPSSDELKSVSTQIMNGTSLTTLADQLMKNNKAEFNKYYTANSSNETFVNELYKNVLHREPDPNALKYHIYQLDHKQKTRAQLVVYFTQSNENITRTRATMWCVVADFGCQDTGGGDQGTQAGKTDPVTGYVEPDDSNTGYKAAGLALSDLKDMSSICNSNTSYSRGYGSYVVITADNTTLSNGNIPCGIQVSANNVTIKNSYINSKSSWGVRVTSSSYTGTKIIKTELYGNDNASNDSAVSGSNYTVTDSNIHGWVDGFKADANVTLTHNWVHEFCTGNGNHNDGVQISYTGNIQVLGNKFEARTKSESGGISSTVYTNQDYGVRPNNVVVKGNWINAGGYFIRVDATNFKIENNRFGDWSSYGILTVAPGSTWTQSGNVMDATGSPVKL